MLIDKIEIELDKFIDANNLVLNDVEKSILKEAMVVSAAMALKYVIDLYDNPDKLNEAFNKLRKEFE
jgi:hypothetical protein